MDFDANLAPFWFQKSSKILSKINPENHQNFDRFGDRFLIELWLIFWSQNGAKLAPKSDRKSMSTSKGRFSKKHTNTYEEMHVS